MSIVKRVLITVAIITLIICAILISIKAYYVAIMLIVGVLLIGHREIWSLITSRKMPPIDERVRENTGKSIRNGFIFLITLLALMMLPVSGIVSKRMDIGDIFASIFVAGTMAYVISYFFYDRIAPKLTTRGWKMLKIFLLTAGIGFVVCILSIFLHNIIYALFDIEEPVFFIIAVIIAPLAVIVGFLGSIVIAVNALIAKSS